MSVKIMSRVWEHSKQSAGALLLLLAIADNADDDGYCWPGGEYLAKKVRMSYRSVMRLVQSIEESGELYCEHNRRNGNKYLVVVGMNEKQIGAGLLKFKYEEKKRKSICDKLLYDTGVTSDKTSCHNRCDTAMSEEPSVSVIETSSWADSISKNPPSALDIAFGPKPPSDTVLPEKVNLHDQDERERYALRLQEQRKARAEGEPWLTQYEWITKPRSGIERDTLRRTAHTLVMAGIPEPESDAVKVKWRAALESIYIESGGDFKLIEQAGKAMVASGLQFWPTHKWVDQVIALKAERAQNKTSTFKARSVWDDDGDNREVATPKY